MATSMKSTLSLCTLAAALFFTCLSAAPIQVEKRLASVENSAHDSLTLGLHAGLIIAVS